MLRKVLFLGLLLSPVALTAAQDSQDFRIARISYLEGRVSFQHGNQLDWAAASINMPLQPGDRIYTGEDGRAEIEFDDGSVLRMAERADVEVLTLREQLIQLRILVGLCSLTARSSVEFEINTPAAAFTTLEPGNYRFDIAENGDSDGIVRKGAIEAVNQKFSRRVRSGEVLHVPAAENETEILSRYDQRDAWDEWNDRRNADLAAYDSRRYIPDSVYIGVGDLDRYGQWMMVDGYGYGWVPRVAGHWSPYWDGRWCYRPNWGWTWISYEPWGWLPYHYGRWHHSMSFGWAWLPGPSFGFHFWSPGLVRFYHGPSWVSWCPLGPGDYYNVNHYRYNTTYNYYMNNLRLLQKRGPNDLFNQNVAGAIRTVRTDQFVNSGPGGRMDQVGIPQNPWRGGRVVTDALDLAPTTRSYAPAPDRAFARPTSVEPRAVVVRTNPAVRSSADRFVRVGTGAGEPQVGTEAVRGTAAAFRRADPNTLGNSREQPSRDVRAAPNTLNPRTLDVPDRQSAPARVYQIPQSRSGTANPPATGGEVQRVPDRQNGSSRTPPPASAGRSNSDQPSRIQRSDPPVTTQSQQVNRPSATRQDPVRQPAEARPQTIPPARTDPPVTKDPVKKLQSNYVPRQAQTGRWVATPASAAGGSRTANAAFSSRSYDASTAVRANANSARPVTQSQAFARSMPSTPQAARPASSAAQAMRSAPSYSQVMRSAPSAPQIMRSMPSGLQPMRSAPSDSQVIRSMPSGSQLMRGAPQSVSPRSSGGGQAAGRRIR